MTQEEYDRIRLANLALSQARAPRRASRDARSEAVKQVAKRTASEAAQAGQGPAAEPSMLMGADTTGLEVSFTVKMKQIPTSFVHVLDPEQTPLVTFRFRNCRRKKARLKLVTRVEGFSTDAIDTLELAPDQRGELSQLPVFLLDRIAAVIETRAASLYIRVEDLDGRVEQEATQRLVLLPRTTAYLAIRNDSGETIDLTRYLAAWVTPNAPEVLQLLREAAALHTEQAIVGYQSAGAEGMPAIVTAQVAAMYRALQERKLTYVNSLVAFNLDGSSSVQRVRSPRESLATASANCIDGVVLMASLIEAASLNAAMVIVPGHAFVAFALRPYSDEWDFVETTLLGSASFEDALAAGRQIVEELGRDQLKILPLATLRTVHRIFPME